MTSSSFFFYSPLLVFDRASRALCASTVNPIKKTQSTKVDPRLFVMQVMFLSKDRKEVIPAMCNHRLQCSCGPKQKACKDMTAQNLWRQPEGEDGRHKVLQRMCVLRSQSNWSLELMVLVVYTLVERFDVQEAMRVVEDDFAAKDADNEVAHNFRCSGYGIVEAVERRATC